MNSCSKQNQKEFLMKSKKALEKLNYKISDLAKKTYKPTTVLRTIQETTHQIENNIENKIQQNFTSMLNAQTIVHLDENNQLKSKPRDEGTKCLMDNYWNKQTVMQTKKKKNVEMMKQNIFPPIKQTQTISQESKIKKTAIISSLNVKLYEKQKQKQNMRKYKEEKLLSFLYTYMVHIIDYKVQNDSAQFLLFQKTHYSKWDDIEETVKAIQHFCEHYTIKYCTLDLQKLLDLIEFKSKKYQKEKQKQNDSSLKQKGKKQKGETPKLKQVYTAHQLLNCLENAEEISAENSHQKGIRFFGIKGKIRAIVKIQAAIRGKLSYETCKKIKSLIQKIVKIQKAYCVHLQYLKTKQKIRQICLQKYKWFTNKQKKFRSEYRLCELSKSVKYQIHISCHSVSEWQRVSTEYYLQKHNSQITRIFRAATSNNQTTIIYVTPLPIPQQVMKYYFKLLELGGLNDFRRKIIILSPDEGNKFLDKEPLTRLLYYSPKILKKIKLIISNNYAYIVPSIPSIDYISICHYLDVPLYSCQPQKLLYIQSKSGTKHLIEQISKKSSNFSKIPFSINVYSEEIFIRQFSNLIINNPGINRWVLKIDNELDSRGIGSININKILPKRIIKYLKISQKQQFPKTQVINQILKCLRYHFQENLSHGDEIQIVGKVYRNQQQFLKNLYVNGGIIEAAMNSFKSEPEVLCVSIVVQPDSQWKILSKYHKIIANHKTIGCFYCDSRQEDSLDLEIDQLFEINQKVREIVEELIIRESFGFFSIDFMKINEQNQVQSLKYFNQDPLSKITTEEAHLSNQYEFLGIKCYLDNLSAAHFMRQFICKESHALYIPIIIHQNIKRITMSTFFHLCRLQNLSFDIENRIGNIFMFLDGLESGCIGLMTFNHKSKIEVFIHAAQVLQFFCNKLSKTNALNEMFLSIRNAVNGYLNRERKKSKNQNVLNKKANHSENIIALR